MGRTKVGRWGRLGTAVVLGGLMSFAAAGVAAAADAATTPVTGVAGGGQGSFRLFAKGGGQEEVGVITLAIGGNKPVEAYCIDLKHPLKDGGTYQETAWNASKINDLGKVQWILTHSWPKVDNAKEVLGNAGVTQPGSVKDSDLPLLVYAATQGAIWHFSDGFDLATHAGDKYGVVEQLYTYLRDHAVVEQEPAPTLSITPPDATGELGSKLGPYTVNTSSSSPVTLTASAGKIVGADDAPLTGTVKNGAKFWLTNDQAGKVTVDATGEGAVPTGRVFTYQKRPDEAQKIILAGEVTTKLTAHASGTFTPKAAPAPAAPSLPVTGASTVGAVVGGIALLVGGGVLVVLLRRRRVKFTA